VTESDFGQIEGGSPSTPANESSARLEAKVSELEAKLGEERFLWTLLVIILLDCMVFERFSTWAAPLSIAVLEIVLFVVLARKCRVPDITMLLNKITEFYGSSHRRRSPETDSDPG
jgi:hypothetical protein